MIIKAIIIMIMIMIGAILVFSILNSEPTKEIIENENLTETDNDTLTETDNDTLTETENDTLTETENDTLT